MYAPMMIIEPWARLMRLVTPDEREADAMQA
jgi:hypothetical protein